MPETKNPLKVLLICKQHEVRISDVFADIKNILKTRFESRVERVSQLNDITTAFYRLVPHFVVLDSSYQELIQRLNENPEFLSRIKKIPFLIVLFPLIEEKDVLKIPLPNVTLVQSNVTKKQIEEILRKMARKSGFNTMMGKTRKRLVQRPIKVSVTIENEDITFSGITTGLNKNGLGARINTGKNVFEAPRDLIGSPCKVLFNDPALCFMPVKGTLIRFEESWDSDFDAFIAVTFNKKHFYFDDSEIKMLSELIKNQEDESIIKQPPEPESDSED